VGERCLFGQKGFGTYEPQWVYLYLVVEPAQEVRGYTERGKYLKEVGSIGKEGKVEAIKGAEEE